MRNVRKRNSLKKKKQSRKNVMVGRNNEMTTRKST